MNMKTEHLKVIVTAGGMEDSVVPVNFGCATDIIRTLDAEEISLVSGGPETEVSSGVVPG